MGFPGALSGPSPQKFSLKIVSYIFSKKMFFLYFGKLNFLAQRLKTFLYFLKKGFSYIFGKGTFYPYD